jgi:hypothetical protein
LGASEALEPDEKRRTIAAPQNALKRLIAPPYLEKFSKDRGIVPEDPIWYN